ncbi:MAG: hypothetical protein KKE17_11850 [Proteobacteria bacterium]|nr:hypothetical protein [Pseudomonadota bacterium]MBU1710689.1 hypothetical protein [Pseudomonadota bacterium]
MTLICCLCQRIKCSGGWIEQVAPPGKNISHGYCPECFQFALQKLRADILSKRFGGSRKKDSVVIEHSGLSIDS